MAATTIDPTRRYLVPTKGDQIFNRLAEPSPVLTPIRSPNMPSGSRWRPGPTPVMS